MRLHKIDTSFGGIVQLVEHRTHIPYVIGSSPIAPTYFLPTIFHVVGIFFVRQFSFGPEPIRKHLYHLESDYSIYI